MSYARFSDTSNVYIFSHEDGGIVCCGCWLTLRGGGVTFRHFNFESLVEHLQEHIALGHLVPEDLLDEETYDMEDFR